MLMFTLVHPKATQEHLGFIPGFFSEHNPKPAKEQIHKNYQHGGGWYKLDGFKRLNDTGFKIKYPGDPALQILATAKLRDETIVIYQDAFVGIFQPDGTFEVARID
jgi:hypothetical protein